MIQPAITKLEELSFNADFVITKSLEASDGAEKGDWIIEGFAATTDVDLQDEEIEQSAIEGAAKDLQKNSTVLFNHDEERPIAKVILAEPRARKSVGIPSGLTDGDSAGIFVRMKLSKTEESIWKKVQEGIINKLSIRGRVLDAVKRWSETLKKYVKVIKKMTLVEVSLVSVPANPEAKTLGWYVAKTLNDFTKSGGDFPREGKGSPADEGATMSGDAKTTTTATAPAATTPAPTMVELAFGLTDIEKSMLGRVHSVVDGLLAVEKDEARKSTLAVIKGLADELTIGKAQMMAKPLPAGVMASLSASMKRAKFEQIASIVEGLYADESATDAKKNLGELVGTLKPAPAAIDPVLALTKLEEGSSDDKVKLAFRTALDFLKSNKSMAAIAAPAKPTEVAPTVTVAATAQPAPPAIDISKAVEATKNLEDLLKKLATIAPALASAISKAEKLAKGKPMGAGQGANQTDADETESGGDVCPPNADGMCPTGYVLQDGMCYSSSAAGADPATASKKNLGVAPASAPTTPAVPASVAPVAAISADALAKALKDAVQPIAKRLGEIERRAGIKKSLDGQEGIDSPEASSSDSKPLSKALLDPARGALRQAGAIGAAKKPKA